VTWLWPALAAAAVALAAVLVTDGRVGGKAVVRLVYDRLGPRLFSSRSEEERWRALAREIGLGRDDRVLDVGCAVGDVALTLAEHGCEVAGLDWSPRMVARAREEAERRSLPARFEVHDAREPLPFPDGAFDAVSCFGLLETLREREPLLRELVRVLAPGGTLALSLYRGRAALTAATSLAWYRERLRPLGLADLRVVPSRRSQDVLLARR